MRSDTKHQICKRGDMLPQRRNRSCRFSLEDLARVRDWIERQITFFDHELFRLPDVETRLATMCPATLDNPVESSTVRQGIMFVHGMVESALLSQPEEVYLFTWMNYLRFRAERTRQRLCLNTPDLWLVQQIEADLAQSILVRNRIVTSNLRLLVSLAKKQTDSLDQMAELIGEATIPLIRSVELFDVSLGNRFSTYATWAVRNHMWGFLKRRRQLSERTVTHDHFLDSLVETRSNAQDDIRLDRQRADKVIQLLACLSERERFVITARFGLDGQPRGQSLRVIASQLGISKERVRQITLHAVEKLQGITNLGALADG